MEKINKRKQPEVPQQVFVSIDPGFENFGFAIATKAGSVLKVVHTEVCQIHDWKDTNPIHLIDSLKAWYKALDEQMKELAGESANKAHFIIEQQYWSPKYAAVGLRLRTLQTALVAVLHLDDCDVTLMPSATVKRHYGIHTKNRAQNKVEMKSILKEQFGIEEDDEHKADCILLLLYFVKNKTK